jgi:uncharacterized membrane protein
LLYFILKALHIAGASVLIGSKPVCLFGLPRVRAASESWLCTSFLTLLAGFEKAIVVPSGLVLLGTGLLMSVGPLSGPFKIMSPLGHFVIAGFFLLQAAGYFMRQAGANGQAIEAHYKEHGAVLEEAFRKVQKAILTAMVLDCTALVIMVIKP